MSIEIDQILVPPGERVLIRHIDWAAFERFLEASDEDRGTRIAYDTGVLELTTPLLEHEDDKEIIGDLIKALLEELDIEFRNAGSTTFRSRAMDKGIEPDQCFYIRNEARIRGKRDIDLTIDPPPRSRLGDRYHQPPFPQENLRSLGRAGVVAIRREGAAYRRVTGR